MDLTFNQYLNKHFMELQQLLRNGYHFNSDQLIILLVVLTTFVGLAIGVAVANLKDKVDNKLD